MFSRTPKGLKIIFEKFQNQFWGALKGYQEIPSGSKSQKSRQADTFLVDPGTAFGRNTESKLIPKRTFAEMWVAGNAFFARLAAIADLTQLLI